MTVDLTKFILLHFNMNKTVWIESINYTFRTDQTSFRSETWFIRIIYRLF